MVWWLAVVFFVQDSRAEIAADGIAKSPEEDDGRSRLFQRFDVDNDGAQVRSPSVYMRGRWLRQLRLRTPEHAQVN